MTTVTQAVRSHINNSPPIEDALGRGILNLSAYALEIKPQIEKNLMKSVEKGSIVMALKRIGDQLKIKEKTIAQNIQTGGELTVRSNLVEYTFVSSESLANKYGLLSQHVSTYPNAFFTLTKGLRETTLIISSTLEAGLIEVLHEEKLISKIENLASITITHSKDVVYTPGFHYSIFKALVWENLNVIESVSAYTEFTVIVDNVDVDKAFAVIKNLLNT